jgi:hypothetical protein
MIETINKILDILNKIKNDKFSNFKLEQGALEFEYSGGIFRVISTYNTADGTAKLVIKHRTTYAYTPGTQPMYNDLDRFLITVTPVGNAFPLIKIKKNSPQSANPLLVETIDKDGMKNTDEEKLPNDFVKEFEERMKLGYDIFVVHKPNK